MINCQKFVKNNCYNLPIFAKVENRQKHENTYL